MSTIKAIVQRGRLTLDEPTELPEGTVLELFPGDFGDEMDAAELARLDAALEKAAENEKAGMMKPADDLIATMRASR